MFVLVCLSVCVCGFVHQLESAGRVLKVLGARQEDSGKYTCLATNAAGEAQKNIRLSVHGKGTISSGSSTSCFLSFVVIHFSHLLRCAYVWPCANVYFSQCPPRSQPLETSSTRPSYQASRLSLSARPQAVHYLVRLTNALLSSLVQRHNFDWPRAEAMAFPSMYQQKIDLRWLRTGDFIPTVILSMHCSVHSTDNHSYSR